MTIGDQIRNHRQMRRWTQAELGQFAFVSKATISRWETGEHLPDYQNIDRLEEIFGVPLFHPSEAELQSEDNLRFLESRETVHTWRATIRKLEPKSLQVITIFVKSIIAFEAWQGENEGEL